MIKIPGDTKTFIQTNRSNVLGNLWATFNIDLQSNLGRVRVGQKLKLNTKTGDTNATNLGLPVAFEAFDSRMFAAGGGRIFKNTTTASKPNLLSAFVEDTSTGAPTTLNGYSDMTTFNNTLVVSAPTTVYSKPANGSGTGSWTDRTANLTSGTLHKTCKFSKYDRLYVSDNQQDVKSCNTSWVWAAPGEDYALDLSDSSDVGYISTIAASSELIWIGTTGNDVLGTGTPVNSAIFSWDGISSKYLKKYDIDASGVYAIKIIEDIPYAMDSRGRLLEFNGTGFKEIGRLPLRENQYLASSGSALPTEWYIHNNGIDVTQDGTIVVFIKNTNALNRGGASETINENLPSGVWEWSRDNGFVHKHSISLLSITSSSNTDFGQNKLSSIGALKYAKVVPETAISISSIICGATYYTDATTTTSGIFAQAPFPHDNSSYPEGQKLGYIVTTWIDAGGFKDTWAKIFARHRKLIDSSDQIILKYRTSESDPVQVTITWTSTTTFTTTTNVSSYVGYEVEGIQGNGSGGLGHISSVSENAGTYTVTVDNAFTGATSGTAKVRLQNWTKIGTLSGQVEEGGELSINANSTRIQLKCAMFFTGDGELHDLTLINNPDKPFE
jgi:hypothetical protein